MNKTSLFSVFSFVGILMCFSSFALQTQSEKQFTIMLKILPEVVGNENCVIEIIKNGKETSKVDIPVNGEYNALTLDYFNKYSLSFKYPGHLIKILPVSTEVPQEVWHKDPNFPPFPLLISLVKKTTENAGNELCKPSRGIAYDKEVDNFVMVELNK